MLSRIGFSRAKALRCGCLLACVAIAAPAQAQIYSWRDTNGHLVLSNTHRESGGAAITTFAVPKAATVRATRSAAVGRGRLYDDLIDEHCRKHSVRPDLVRAVMQVESGFNPLARSPKGAMGLMQLMPATAVQYGVKNPFNPAENVRAGVAYLRQLLDRYQNKEELALAAYNAGPTAVDRHGQAVPPYRETRNYVAQINQMAGRQITTRDNQIYKITETIDGRTVVRYTDKKPAASSYIVVSQ